MSRVLPAALKDRPELNLRQGIKSSLNSWRQLIASLYLFYFYVQGGGDSAYSKENHSGGSKVSIVPSDAFATWLDANFSDIANIKQLVAQCPLFLAQMEHLQVGLELFLKLAKVEFVNSTLADAVERTGGNRYAKALRFSTNMKILADVINSYSTAEKKQFLSKWLSGEDESIISTKAKEILAPFTEECQFKIRTATNEIYFQQDGVYDGLRNSSNTVESSDAHEPVGPFRILKSYVKEGMHPYIIDSSDGFKARPGVADFAKYADMVRTALSLIPKRTTVYQEVSPAAQPTTATPTPESRQIITYGAPGSGKSWSVKGWTKGEDTIRTTFHPDSDYSTFVGSYKPSVEKDKFQTVVTAGERNSTGTLNKKDELFTQKRIVYKFVAQSFIKAYVDAWKYKAAANGGEATRKYLVIEEINRGNCAQIFGDLFQLLDRNDEGFSDYEIAADDDLQNYLAEQFADLAKQNETAPINLGVDAKLAKRILSGAVMLLPENLYIWATMNTSDQSLFPIDSAFKRRWEWKYMPIYDAQKDYKIVVDGDEYKWWDFLEKANALVHEFTDSEDKKLGYFFCKADASNTIPLEQFVGKVIFYLWNDVFKDAGFDHKAFDGDNGERLLFKTFFNPDGSPKAATVKKLMQNLGVVSTTADASATPTV